MKKRLFFLVLAACCLTACKNLSTEKASEKTEIQIDHVDNDDVVEILVEEKSVIAEETELILPLPVSIDVNRLEDCTVAIALAEGDIFASDSGELQMNAVIYTYDLYDMVDISKLENGNRILIGQEEIEVTSVEWTDSGVLINGGLECGGYDFSTDENGVFYEQGYSDVKSYYTIGNALLKISEDFVYVDGSDLDLGEITYSLEEFMNPENEILYNFGPNNTSIVIEGGVVTELRTVYVP